MKKKRVLIIVIAVFIVIALAVYLWSSLEYNRRNELLEKKYASFSRETIQISSIDDYKELFMPTEWGFAFPEKQVVDTNGKKYDFWSLGDSTDFLYHSGYNEYFDSNGYGDYIYKKSNVEFPKLDSQNLTNVTFANKSFYALSKYDETSDMFIWSEDISVNSDFSEKELTDFGAFLNGDTAKEVNYRENLGWYIADLEESGYILSDGRIPYGFIIRLYFNENNNLYNQEYMLCMTDKGEFFVINAIRWAPNYHTNYAYPLSEEINQKLNLLLSDIDYCTKTAETFNELCNTSFAR